MPFIGNGLFSDIIRASSKELELERVRTELSNLRNVIHHQSDLARSDYIQFNLKEKRKVIWKLVYVYMLGYDIDFGHMEIIELIGSHSYSDKFCGYTAASVIFRDQPDLLRLIINTLKNDLNNCYEALRISAKSTHSSNANVESMSIINEIRKLYSKRKFEPIQHLKEAIGSIALNCISNSATVDIAVNLFLDVKKIAEIPRENQTVRCHYIRSKAIICLLKLYQCCPDILPAIEWTEKLITDFQYERNIGCLLCLCSLIQGCLERQRDMSQTISIKFDYKKESYGSNFLENPTTIVNKVHQTQTFREEKGDDTLNEDYSTGKFPLEEWKDIVPQVISTLARIRSGDCPSGYIFHKVPSFWLQIKLIEILQYFELPKSDLIIVRRIYELMEDIYLNAIHVTKQNLCKVSGDKDYDSVAVSCTIGIAYEISRYISRIYDEEFPQNIVYLLGIFLINLLYMESIDYISLSLSLLFECLSISAVTDMCRKNIAIILHYSNMNDLFISIYALRISVQICNSRNWKFIAKELLNNITHKIINLNGNENTDMKSNFGLGESSFDGYGYNRDQSYLEEFLIHICYLVRKFAKSYDISLKVISIIFQHIQNNQSIGENSTFALSDSSLFQIMDILCGVESGETDSNNLPNERKELVEDPTKSLEYIAPDIIKSYAAYKGYKTLTRIIRNSCILTVSCQGIRWICFLIGEYGSLITNKVPITHQVGVLLQLHDIITIINEQENLVSIKSMILLAFTKLYCHTDTVTQNHMLEKIKLDYNSCNLSQGTSEFLDTIIMSTTNCNTPSNYTDSPIIRNLLQNSLNRNKHSDLQHSSKLSDHLAQVIPTLDIPIAFRQLNITRCPIKQLWHILCLLKEGNLYSNTYLTVYFKHGKYSNGTGECYINLKFHKVKSNCMAIRIISTDIKLNVIRNTQANTTNKVNAFQTTIVNNICGTYIDDDKVIEQTLITRCGKSYLNPPLYIITLSIAKLNEETTEVLKSEDGYLENEHLDNNLNQRVKIPLRLPIILTQFMLPTKDMTDKEFEYFWNKFGEVSANGTLSIPLVEVPLYLSLLNFNTNKLLIQEYSRTHLSTSTLCLENYKRIPCMVKVRITQSSNQIPEQKVDSLKLNKHTVDINVRSSSIAVAKVVKYILVSYILVNPN
ncbi:AP-2 complex alpha subunit protein [Cryptosporidium andersoni]|uniref:AP-2 complex alpha subunit protein n=1 Tax=Cryptosporidium andersoni TaxID=117008 RepID=A0A1J4MTL1_9CRYT|nr:AP-2 complex alpha subunit protein [Cryptosporidium andersoni]